MRAVLGIFLPSISLLLVLGATGHAEDSNLSADPPFDACGTPIEANNAVFASPATQIIASFEDKNPFEGGTVVEEHATEGRKGLRVDKGYIAMVRPQDWALGSRLSEGRFLYRRERSLCL